MKTYNDDDIVAIPPFSRQADGEEIVIANSAMDSYLAVPPVAVEVLDSLAAGTTIGEVKRLHLVKYGEELDIDDFLSLMEVKRFVFPPTTPDHGSVTASSSNSETVTRGNYHFDWIPQPLAASLFSAPMISIAVVIISGAILALCMNQTLRPHAVDFIFPEQRVFSFLIFASLAMLGVYLHELSHVIAARALGVNSRLAIGHRLWFLVAEADITGIWTMPKNQRYLPILAGMLTDAVSASVLTILLWAHDLHWMTISAFTLRIVRALTLSYWLRISWQFYVFVRTDVYFAFTTWTGCKNLLHDTETYLWNLVRRITSRRASSNQEHIPSSEMRIVRYYSLLWVAGRVCAFYVLVTITVPVAVGYLRSLASTLSKGFAAAPYSFVDSVVFAMFFLLPFFSGLFLWLRGLARNERG